MASIEEFAEWLEGQSGDPNVCWSWRVDTLESGAGRVAVAPRKRETARRVAFRILVDAEVSPSRLWVHCGDLSCVNPAHMMTGKRPKVNHTVESLIDSDFDQWLPERADVVPGQCWRWMLSTTGGYGNAHVGGVQHVAHRVVYERLVGPVPEGMQLDHLCRNRACVNPDHLEPVTASVNVKRGSLASVKRAEAERSTQCPNGHERAPENMFIGTDGRRRCRLCQNARQRRAYHARKLNLTA